MTARLLLALATLTALLGTPTAARAATAPPTPNDHRHVHHCPRAPKNVYAYPSAVCQARHYRVSHFTPRGAVWAWRS